MSLYSDQEFEEMRAWIDALPNRINMSGYAVYPNEWVENGYWRNVTGRMTWRLRKAIQQSLHYINSY